MCAYFFRWSVCVTLCCVVLLVVVCNVLGLVLGPLGLKPKEDPMKRSCTANCGGIFLMMWVLALNVGFMPRGLVLLWPLTWMYLQECRFQLLLLLAVHDCSDNTFLGGWKCLHTGLPTLEQWTTAKGSDIHSHMYLQIHVQCMYIYMYALLFCSQLVDSSGLIPLPQITLSSGMKMNISISDIYRYVMPDIHVPCSFLKKIKCLSNRAKKKPIMKWLESVKTANCGSWEKLWDVWIMHNKQNFEIQ